MSHASQWRILYLLASAWSGGIGPDALSAQKPSAALARYADRIISRADSAFEFVLLLTEPPVVDAPSIALHVKSAKDWMGFDSLGSLASNAQHAIVRLRDDFDALDPPPYLVRLHQQLISAIAAFALAADGTSVTAYLCTHFPDQPYRCAIPLARASTAAMQAREAYRNARLRAVRILADSGVTLAELREFPFQRRKGP